MATRSNDPRRRQRSHMGDREIRAGRWSVTANVPLCRIAGGREPRFRADRTREGLMWSCGTSSGKGKRPIFRHRTNVADFACFRAMPCPTMCHRWQGVVVSGLVTGGFCAEEEQIPRRRASIANNRVGEPPETTGRRGFPTEPVTGTPHHTSGGPRGTHSIRQGFRFPERRWPSTQIDKPGLPCVWHVANTPLSTSL